MRRTAQPSPGSDLFDLPLLVDPQLDEAPEAEREPSDVADVEPTADAEQIELSERKVSEGSVAEPVAERHPGRDRVTAGLIDTALVALVPLFALAGAAALGVRPGLGQAPAYLFITLQASFVYLLFCLLFWSRTPGMRRAGLVARSADSRALSVGQAIRRWVGNVVTVALLGVPALSVLRGGPSLADRLSGTRLERTGSA